MVSTTVNNTSQGMLARIRQFEWQKSIVYIGFLVLFAFFSITLSDSGFLTPNNLLNIVRQTAIISVMAVAVTFVIAAGEIDLSVGAVAGLASVMTALVLAQYGLLAGIVAGVLTGVLVGGANGLLRTAVGIPSFLVTLGMMGIARGSAMWITDTAPVPILNETYNNIFGSGELGPVPSLLLWMVTALVVGYVVLRKTAYGRQVLATGGNEAAARFSGVNTRKIKLLVLMVSSTVAALAGMLYAGRLHTGRFQLGEGDELSVIAAVILGGTSLSGGAGTIVGSVIGALMIGLINNGLILMGLEVSQQVIIRGSIIILAVALGRKSAGS
ncbi:MAG: ABC transporter permease [Anaerolineae bacterium]|nr:ABC transporter permease [Anaerolineae bacterium]MCI0608253.1 ABC transporter permease [Anaerolineae bacterium]